MSYKDAAPEQAIWEDLAWTHICRVPVNGRRVVDNAANRQIVFGWLHEDQGERPTVEWFKEVLAEPGLADQVSWEPILSPEQRKQAAAQRVAHARDVFGIVCRKHNLSLAEANFRLLFDAGLLDSEFTADQAVASNAVTLAQATPQEAAKFHQERVDDYNEALLKADLKELRARVRQEAEQARVVNAQAEADKALAAAQTRDAARGGFPPLPPEITSEVIRKATPDQIKFWIKKYSNSNVTARLQNRG
jgi:hypothetical protein